MKISTKLAVLFSVIIIFVGLIPSYFFFTFSAKQLDASVTGKLEGMASDAMNMADRMFYERYLDIRMLAANPVITTRGSTPKQITERLIAYKNAHPAYMSISFFDLNRTRIADTGGEDIGVQHAFSEYWPAMSAGKDFVSSLSYSESAGSPVFYFAALVKSREGVPLGVVVSRLYLESFGGILQDHLDEYKLRNGASVELLDKNGMVIYSSRNKADMFKKTSHEWGRIKDLLGKGESSGEIGKPDGEAILVFAKEAGYRDFKGDGWVLAIELPKQVAFASLRELRDRSRLILLVMAALVFPAVFMFSRTIVRPVGKLMEAAAEIGKGNLGVRVDIASNDELGKLAASFNRMAADLKNANDASDKAELRNREQQELILRVIESIPHYVFWKDRESNYLGCNANFASVAGLDSPVDIVGKTDFDLPWSKQEAESYRKMDHEIMDSGEARVNVEEKQLQVGGNRVDVLTSKVPLRDADGKIMGILGLYSDITERKQMEDAILKIANLYRSLFDNMLHGFAYCKMLYDNNQPHDFIYIEVNQAFCQLTGLANVVGKRASELMPGIRQANSELFEIYGRVAAGGKPEKFETYVAALDIWFSLSVYSAEKGYFSAIFDNVTPYKRAEAALRNSEAKLLAILNSSEVGIAWATEQGAIEYINPKFTAMFGYTLQDAATVAQLQLLALPDATYRAEMVSRWNANVREAREKNTGTEHMELAVACKDGAVRYVILAGSWAGSYLVASFSDITERKMAEEKLYKSRASLRAIMDNAPYMIWLKDTDGRYLAANMEFLKASGRAQITEVIGKTDHDIWPQELAEKFRADDAEVMATRQQRLIEEFAVNSAGKKSWVETFKMPVEDKEGKLLGTSGFSRDTTERRRMERELRHDARLFEALLNINELGGTLPENEFLHVSLEAAEKLTGSRISFCHFVHEDQETIELGAWSAETTEKYCQAAYDNHYPVKQAGIWADCLRQRRPVIFNDCASYEGKHGLPEGHSALQRLVSVPVMEEGRVRLILGVGNKEVNYTEDEVKIVQLIGNDLWRIVRRQRTEAELKQNLELQLILNKKLEEAQSYLLQSEKMAALGQLAAGVAHELNNPLGFVHSNLGTLENYLNDIFTINAAYEDAGNTAGDSGIERFNQLKQEKDYDYIKKDVFQLMAESKEGLFRMRRIVQDLKNFSRVGEEGWQWADLHKGLDSTLNIVWNELKYKCKVNKEYGELPEVYCMPPQLNQVFMNLLVNAGQAIEENGVINIRTGVSGDEVWVEVEDNGKGIAPEQIHRVFEPFFTTKPVGVGTGLGLSLSYSIVQKHNGRIEVTSTQGAGTRMRVWLPIKPPAAQPEAPAAGMSDIGDSHGTDV